MPPASDVVINASELGEFAYCRRAWWLHRVCGLAPGNAPALACGRLLHEGHGRRVRWAIRTQRAAALILLGAILAVAAGAYLMLAWGGGS